MTTCQNCKTGFEIYPEDKDFYLKMSVPLPTFCPFCRFIRRIAFRNERKLFRVKSAFSGQDIFALYPVESGRKIVTQEEWFSDSWNATDFGCEYDFTRDFFTQIFELATKVPIYNLNAKLMVGSPYSGNATALKNCYLVFNSNYTEDSLYGNAINHSRDCVDCSYLTNCERCYESFQLESCYRAYFSSECNDSSDIWFSRNLSGCLNCFGCVNLRNKSYYFFNQKYSKEEYEAKLQEYQLDTADGILRAKKEVKEFFAKFPRKYLAGLKNQDSDGVYVTNSKNTHDSFLVQGAEDVRYCQYIDVPKNKDCYDISVWGENCELCYETSVSGDGPYNLKFCFDCWPNNRECEYSMHLKNCSNCFGCVGLKNKQYCIFNTQYSKEEYTLLREKIIAQMNDAPYVDASGCVYRYGEFFPIDFADIGYNNSIAMEHAPLTEVEARAKGYQWHVVPKGEYAATVSPENIPKSIQTVLESITKEIFSCQKCNTAYRIMPYELLCLKREGIALPNYCVDCRHAERISERLPAFTVLRACDCSGITSKTGEYTNSVAHSHAGASCGNTFKTGFKSETDTVYCDECYREEVE